MYYKAMVIYYWKGEYFDPWSEKNLQLLLLRLSTPFPNSACVMGGNFQSRGGGVADIGCSTHMLGRHGSHFRANFSATGGRVFKQCATEVRFWATNQWFQSLFRCRIWLWNFSMGCNIIAPYMEMLHINRFLHHWNVCQRGCLFYRSCARQSAKCQNFH